MALFAGLSPMAAPLSDPVELADWAESALDSRDGGPPSLLLAFEQLEPEDEELLPLCTCYYSYAYCICCIYACY